MVKNNDYIIFVDNREKKPLWTNNVFEGKLDVGDYSIMGWSDMIAVERKTTADLAGTLGKGHARFKKELERASKLEYFAIVIESNLSNILSKRFQGSVHTGMKGSTIAKIIFMIHFKYGVPIFFAEDRNDAKKVITNIFDAYYKFKTVNKDYYKSFKVL